MRTKQYVIEGWVLHVIIRLIFHSIKLIFSNLYFSCSIAMFMIFIIISINFALADKLMTLGRSKTITIALFIICICQNHE